MGQRHRVAAIGIAIGVCLATPSWSEIGVSPSAADKVPGNLGCDPPDANRRNIVVETVRAGIWKGFSLFRMSCGEITGQLFFGKRGNSLRYLVMRAHQDSDATSISTSVRS